MFDIEEDEVFTAETNTLHIKNIRKITEESMQAYKFLEKEKYSGIFMRFCIGLLDEKEQIDWL